MQLTERDIMLPDHEDYQKIMGLCHLSKNLYNVALYDRRQHYFKTGETKNYGEQKKDLKTDVDYMALPRKISACVLEQVDEAFTSFFALLKLKQKGKYNNNIKLPHYKPKDGYNVLRVPKDAISTKVTQVKPVVYEHTIAPNSLKLKVYSQHGKLDGVRFIPKGNHIIVEKIYTVKEKELKPLNNREASLDPGVNQLAIFSNVAQSLLINMRPLKSINQYYNSRLAGLRSELPKGVKSSKRIKELHLKRQNKLEWELHAIANYIVTYLISNNITRLTIGHNIGWKTGVGMGKRNNQNFVMLPFSKLFSLIKYKCELEGITVIISEESYTSQGSFLDKDIIPVYKKGSSVLKGFSGKRVRRGLYKDSKGRRLNADINGSGNIMRKVVPDAIVYGQGIEGFAMNPMVTTVLHRGSVKLQNVTI